MSAEWFFTTPILELTTSTRETTEEPTSQIANMSTEATTEKQVSQSTNKSTRATTEKQVSQSTNSLSSLGNLLTTKETELTVTGQLPTIIGSVVGGIVLNIVAVIIVFVIIRRRNHDRYVN